MGLTTLAQHRSICAQAAWVGAGQRIRSNSYGRNSRYTIQRDPYCPSPRDHGSFGTSATALASGERQPRQASDLTNGDGREHAPAEARRSGKWVKSSQRALGQDVQARSGVGRV